MKRTVAIAALVISALALEVEEATAQGLQLRAYGLRGGVSFEPDQIHAGGFADAGTFFSVLRFQPGLEMGIGNGVRLLALHFDLVHTLGSIDFLEPFAGAGLGINVIDVTDGVGAGDGLSLEPALNLMGGFLFGTPRKGSRAPGRYAVEGRVGLGKTPNFKLSLGILF